MTPAPDDLNQLGEAVLREIAGTRPSPDRVGAAITAAALVSRLVAAEMTTRDRLIRIACREGATLEGLAEATGLSGQTITDVCA